MGGGGRRGEGEMIRKPVHTTRPDSQGECREGEADPGPK